MASVKVFGSPASAEVARVLTCLFEKDVEFQLIRVENFKGRERKPEYLKLIRTTLMRFMLQPSGQALTFEVGSVTLVGLEPDEIAVKESKRRLERVLNIYEQRLEETKYIAGDKFTLADLSHLPNAHRLITKVPECAALFKERKRVNNWWEAISSRPSWRRVVEMQHEPPAENSNRNSLYATSQACM